METGDEKRHYHNFNSFILLLFMDTNTWKEGDTQWNLRCFQLAIFQYLSQLESV